MSLDSLIFAWQESYRELEIALEGIPDTEVWVRPHPRLLSVGEVVGHIAYGHASWVLCPRKDRPDAGDFPFQSPILSQEFRYYLTSVESRVSLDLSATQLWHEILRIREASEVVLAGLEYDSPYAGQWRTWGSCVQYQVFHVAYHTGQIYSVRHLLGHETEDN